MVLQQRDLLIRWKDLVRSMKHRAQAAVMLLGTTLTACSSTDYELDVVIAESNAKLPQNDADLALERPEDPDFPERGHWGVLMKVPISWEKKDYLQPGAGEIVYSFLLHRYGCRGHDDPETCELLRVCNMDVPAMHVIASIANLDEHYKNIFPPELFYQEWVPTFSSKVHVKRGKKRIKGTSDPFAIQLGIMPDLPLSARWPGSADSIASHLIDDTDRDAAPGVTVHTLGEPEGYSKPPASLTGLLSKNLRIAKYYTAVRALFEWDWVLPITSAETVSTNVIKGRARMMRDGDQHAIYQGRVFGCVKENGNTCSHDESRNADRLIPTFAAHGVPSLTMKRYNPNVTCHQFLDAT